MKFKSLKKKKDFLRTLKSGKRIYTSTVTVILLPSQEARFALCVGKKYGKSVERNRLKRLLREAFRKNAEKLSSPVDVLLLPKLLPEYSVFRFERDIGYALEKFKKL